jgi:hypothetical protein
VAAEEARERQALLFQQLQQERDREQQAEQERQIQLFQLQIELQRLEAEQQRQVQLTEAQGQQRERELAEQQRLAEIQRQLHLETQRQHENWEQQQEATELERQNHAADDLNISQNNPQSRQQIQQQWRSEHERELDPDLELSDHDWDDFSDEDWQRLDDAIGQVWPPEQPDVQAADIFGANRIFEKQARRGMHDEDDNPPIPPINHRDLPKARRPYRDPLLDQTHSLGPMHIVCSQCDALHWKFEKLSASSVRNPRFGNCQTLDF